MASSALDALDLALSAGHAAASGPALEQLTVGQARDRLHHSLELLRPLLGAPPAAVVNIDGAPVAYQLTSTAEGRA